MVTVGEGGRHSGAGPGGRRLGVSEEFYFLAHERDRPLLRPRALGVGLGAAVLGEAVLSGWLQLRGGLVTAVDQRGGLPAREPLAHGQDAPPAAPVDGGGGGDPDLAVGLTRWVWDWVVTEPHRYPVATWVRALGTEATTRVRERLVAAGFLAPTSVWRGHRPTVVDVNAAAWPAARLQQRLEQRQRLTDSDALLLAVADVTGLGAVLLRYATPTAGEHLTVVVADLHHRRPDIAALVEQVRVVIDTGTLTRT
ncbi:MAG: GPP34 family phosphoprotein [Actinobacteria bacterium]|nr:GPP34 family phosphoprotein [Actinomycetota bacterium]